MSCYTRSGIILFWVEKLFTNVTQATLGVLSGLKFVPTRPHYRTAAANIKDEYQRGNKNDSVGKNTQPNNADLGVCVQTRRW